MTYSLSEILKTQFQRPGISLPVKNSYSEIISYLRSQRKDFDLYLYRGQEIEIPNNHGGVWVLKINDDSNLNWGDLDQQIIETLKKPRS